MRDAARRAATVLASAIVAGALATSSESAGAQTSAVPPPLPAVAPTARPETFTPVFTYTGEAAANPVGGVRQGTAFAGQLLTGFDVDFGRLAGDAGGTLHFQVTNRHGNNLADDDIGNDTSVQEVYGGQKFQLAEFAYEQTLDRGRIDLQAGRLAANTLFLHTPAYCIFQSNSICGNPAMIFKDSNLPYYPDPSWGADAKVFVDSRVYVHAGAFLVDPSRTLTTANGFTFNTSHATGLIVPAEIGYTTTFSNDARPRNYVLGAWFDASTYADPLLDAHGHVALLSGDPGSPERGRSGVYLLHRRGNG